MKPKQTMTDATFTVRSFERLHIKDAKDTPKCVVHFIKRFSDRSYMKSDTGESTNGQR